MIIFCGFMMFLSTGCEVEGCTNPNSDNFNAEATADDGSCILWREKFIGQYNVAETCPSGTYNFAINVVQSATSEEAIIINNLGDFGQPVNATVNGSNLTIPSQTITEDNFTLTLDGSGSIAGNIMIINYTYSVLNVGETCTMNCTKQ